MGVVRWVALVLGVFAAGTALHWHGLLAGFALDDYLQLDMLDDVYPRPRSSLDLYRFVDAARGDYPALLDAGTMPWWSHPELRLAAFRPISSALLVADHWAFGTEAIARHVHSLVWWTALVVGVFALADALVGRRIAVVATAAYCVDPAHLVPIAWLANRTALVSAAFGVLALIAHHRWRRSASHLYGGVAAAALGSSLLAGEYGLAMFGYFIGYELVMGTSTRDRARGLAPAALIVLAWLVTRAALGYGAHGSSGYLDPFDTPLDLLAHTVVRLPAMLVNELLTVPSEATFAALVFGHWAALVFITPLLLFVWLVPGMLSQVGPQPRRGVLALSVGSLLSFVPLLPSVPSGRLLVAPSVGGAVLIAALIVDAWDRLRRPRRTAGAWARGVVCGGLALGHLGLAPLVTHFGAKMWTESQRFVRHHYLAAPLDDTRLARQRVVVLNALDPNTLIFPPNVLRLAGRPVPRSWHVLTMTPDTARFTRTSPTRLEVSVDTEEGMLEVPTALFFRSLNRPLRVGDVQRAGGMTIETLAVGKWGPTRLAFEFDAPIDGDSRVFLMLTPSGILRVPLPREGAPLILPGVAQWASVAAHRP